MLTDNDVREMIELANALDRTFGSSDVSRAVRVLIIERSELKSLLEASDNYRKYEVLAKSNGEMLAEIDRLNWSNTELLAACKVGLSRIESDIESDSDGCSEGRQMRQALANAEKGSTHDRAP